MDFDREQLVEAFNYLDDLRASGVTNMRGAKPYIMRDLGHDANTAGGLLSAWMETFDGTSSPEDRADAMLALRAKATPVIASMEDI